jgi:hypothetical protein
VGLRQPAAGGSNASIAACVPPSVLHETSKSPFPAISKARGQADDAGLGISCSCRPAIAARGPRPPRAPRSPPSQAIGRCRSAGRITARPITQTRQRGRLQRWRVSATAGRRRICCKRLSRHVGCPPDFGRSQRVGASFGRGLRQRLLSRTRRLSLRCNPAKVNGRRGTTIASNNFISLGTRFTVPS